MGSAKFEVTSLISVTDSYYLCIYLFTNSRRRLLFIQEQLFNINYVDFGRKFGHHASDLETATDSGSVVSRDPELASWFTW